VPRYGLKIRDKFKLVFGRESHFFPANTMIYAVQSAMYASFLVVAPSSGSSKGGASSGGHKKAEVKAKGSDGKYQGE